MKIHQTKEKAEINRLCNNVYDRYLPGVAEEDITLIITENHIPYREVISVSLTIVFTVPK
jgi:hypothetical protein